MCCKSFSITVGARSSPLSRAQVQEVLEGLRIHHPAIDFSPTFLETRGDYDQNTSLRTLGKTDFFTKEVDALLLEGKCRIAVHSAKDLPDPLPEGLSLVALTRGLDPGDVLVLPPGTTLHELPCGAVIATSSERREWAVNQLRSDFCFMDIRGTIGQRLAKLGSGDVAGVVVAEAALIRLGLTGLNRVRLPGPTTPFQGRLAVLARELDVVMKDLFSCIHSENL